jgi:hypothetical protein
VAATAIGAIVELEVAHREGVAPPGGCLYELVKPLRGSIRAGLGPVVGRACGRGAWRR